MRPLKIINVVGARPNFMKMAPLVAALNQHPDSIQHLLVHTGQHYDEKMSASFFDSLALPRPDIDLGAGSGTHAEQTAGVMVAFEKICLKEDPDLVIVPGDVNSTLACALTAKKLGIKVAHIEAGLRSGDMGMPEEINRICTDVLCDYLFTTDHFANENLIREGIGKERIFFVGNLMIDTLEKHRQVAAGLSLMKEWRLDAGKFAVLTLHRPSNVDRKETFLEILETLKEISQFLPIVFPIHPRTLKMARQFGLEGFFTSVGLPVKGLWLTEPLGYMELLHLNMNAKMVLTDSGGLQEETTVLGVPCITLRPNTERPITCEFGHNTVVGNNKEKILSAAQQILFGGGARTPQVPEKWDGKAAFRVLDVLLEMQKKKI